MIDRCLQRKSSPLVSNSFNAPESIISSAHESKDQGCLIKLTSVHMQFGSINFLNVGTLFATDDEMIFMHERFSSYY